VLEPISGMLWLARKMYSNQKEFNQSWNFGPEIGQKFLTVQEIGDYILTKSNSSLKIDFADNSNQPFESKKLMIDSSKAYSNLDWKNIYTIDDALSEIIAWYKTYQNKQEDMKEFSISQIDNYVAKAKQVNMNWTK
jgi:CDP-glucose 4,6-dehydratase